MTKLAKFRSLCVFFLFCALGTTGCAATVSSLRPEARNLYVLEPGTPRDVVRRTLGAPMVSRSAVGETTDFFEFERGITEAERRNRALLHTTLFVVTLGYWDLAGVPYELMDTEIVRLEVKYDETDHVLSTVAFSGDIDVPGVVLHEHDDLWFEWDEAALAFSARIEETYDGPVQGYSAFASDLDSEVQQLESEGAQLIEDALQVRDEADGR